jgi:uncharacterized membrane protein
MDEFSKLLRIYTVVTIIVIILITSISASFIAGFKVDYNITGIEREKIGYNREYSKENI